MQPSEIEKLPYWEYEIMLQEINETIKKENKENEEQNKKYSPKSIERSSNNIMKGASTSIPKMPSMSSLPSF